jgi:hypothetical protein
LYGKVKEKNGGNNNNQNSGNLNLGANNKGMAGLKISLENCFYSEKTRSSEEKNKWETSKTENCLKERIICLDDIEIVFEDMWLKKIILFDKFD